MKFYIQIKPAAKENRVIKLDETHFKVSVKAPPIDGKANDALIEVLSEYWGIPKSTIQLLRGAGSREKVVQIQ